AAVRASATSEASTALLRSTGVGSASLCVAESRPSSVVIAASFAPATVRNSAASSCCMPMRESRGSSAIVRGLQAGKQHVEQQQRVLPAADVDFHHRDGEACGFERVLVIVDTGIWMQIAA